MVIDHRCTISLRPTFLTGNVEAFSFHKKPKQFLMDITPNENLCFLLPRDETRNAVSFP